MTSKELATQICEFMKDMDFIDYEDTYDDDVETLTEELDKAKELGLVGLIYALKVLTE